MSLLASGFNLRPWGLLFDDLTTAFLYGSLSLPRFVIQNQFKLLKAIEGVLSSYLAGVAPLVADKLDCEKGFPDFSLCFRP
jgi:hypothetical protein